MSERLASYSLYDRLAARGRRAIAVQVRKRAKLADSEIMILALGAPFKRAHHATVKILSMVDDFGSPVFDRERGAMIDTVLGPSQQVRFELTSPCRIRFLCSPRSGRVRLAVGRSFVDLNLRTRVDDTLEFRIPDDLAKPLKSSNVLAVSRRVFNERLDKSLSEAMATKTSSTLQAQTLAIFTPRWRGVAASTEQLFERRLALPFDQADYPSSLTDWRLGIAADGICQQPLDAVVLSGADRELFELAKRLRALRPGLKIVLLWHSNFLQLGEDHDWRMFNMWVEAHRTGIIDRVGVVKRNLDVLLKTMGVDSTFVQNTVRIDPESIQLTKERTRVGLWLSGSSTYRKLPYNFLCAMALCPELRLTGAGLDQTSMKLVHHFKIKHDELHRDAVTAEGLRTSIANTAISAYITISEGVPMLPLESIALGVPCLIGPSCDLFSEDPCLRSTYAITAAGSPAEIANGLRRALETQDEMFPRLVKYMTFLNESSRASVARLLS